MNTNLQNQLSMLATQCAEIAELMERDEESHYADRVMSLIACVDFAELSNALQEAERALDPH